MKKLITISYLIDVPEDTTEGTITELKEVLSDVRFEPNIETPEVVEIVETLTGIGPSVSINDLPGCSVLEKTSLEFVISKEDPYYDKKVNIVKKHFPPTVKVVHVEEMNAEELDNAYIDYNALNSVKKYPKNWNYLIFSQKELG